MLDAVVRYLHDARVAFRVASFPMSEPLPEVAFPLQPGACLIDTRLMLVSGAPAIVCMPHGEKLSLPALARATGAEVLDASPSDLRDEYRGAPEPFPPLGGLLGVPLFVDERVSASPLIAFRAFSPSDIVQLAYEDFARIEAPRVELLAEAGVLPEHASGP